MAHHWPSIQSFFQPDGSMARKTEPLRPGDGFTTEEVDAVLRPTSLPWKPQQEYTEQNIGDLLPGPGRVTLTGRVVNLFEVQTPSKAPRAAKGFIKLILRDDTGALVVRLWFANAAYQLRLGDLCTVHASYIARSDITAPTATAAAAAARQMVSIFPERDSSCHFMIQDEASGTSGLCRTPLGHHEGQPLAGLMTLQNFIDGGEKVDVGIFDDTAEASLVLWGPIGASVAPWRASQTILLLTSPGFKIERRPQLSVTSMTHIDIDPLVRDAEWLRRAAQRLTKRESVNPAVPEGVFDIETVLNSERRTLFTLADLDEL
ncbi:hypothetical protein GP486_003702 [Trichoglossum hirsutum]|uniref:OB domain-containing protein n=1 Tax=Trichoglossum hirsutum TaxID=265104 RepID=A0A9P8RQT5_9PEZI|nr:hypothetical protein GP486_003702 [Trichoglossum hirsutum]